MKPELFRYLHNHSLYNISRPEDCAATANLARHLIKFLGIESTTLDEQVYERCKKLVRNSGKKWERVGCLVKNEGLLQRSEAFEAAWDKRNLVCLAYTNTGLDKGADTEVACDVAPAEARGQKRVILFVRIVLNLH